MRRTLIIAASTIIISFIGVFSFEIFYRLFFVGDNKLSSSMSSAFFGAFLAFIFVRIGDFFKSYTDRTKKGYSAMIKISHVLNNMLTNIDDSVYVIENFETSYKRYKSADNKSHIYIWANKLQPFQDIGDLILELTNVDLINELFSMNVHIRKIADSFDTINASYSESKEAIISKQIDLKSYVGNLDRTYENLVGIKKYLDKFKQEVIYSLAAIRVLSSTKPLINYVLQILPGYKYSKKFEFNRTQAISVLQSELKETLESSQGRLDGIFPDRYRD